MIREAILFGGVVYILITIAQILDRPAVWLEGVVVSVALAAATAFYLLQDEHRLHTSEIIALWAAVLLFGIYGFLKFGGVL
jgi:uncharacterized membrane protein SirB2